MIAVPSIEKFQKSYADQWSKLKENFKGEADSSQLLDSDSPQEFVAALEKLELEKSGVDLNGPVMATVYKDTGIMMARVKDKKKFNKFAPKLFKGSDVQTSEVDGNKIRSLKPKGDRKVPVGWMYSDSMVALGAPGSSGKVDDLHNGLTDFFKKRKSDKSLKGRKAFETFQKSLVDNKSLAVYVNTDNESFTKGFKSQACGKFGSYKSSFCDAVTGQIQGAGFAMRMPAKDHVQLRGWTGWKSKGKKWFDETLTGSRTFDWKRYATEDTTFGMRMAFNPSKFWKDFKGSLKDRTKKGIERQMKAMKQASGGEFEFERDVVGALSGQGGFFAYELGSMSGGPAAAAMTSKYLFVAQASEGTTPKKTIERLKALAGKQVPGTIEISELDGGLQVAKLTDAPMPTSKLPKIYFTDKVFMLASGAFSGGEIKKIINGNREQGPITKADGVEIGTPFAKQDHLNGMYVNVDRLVSQLEKQMKQLPENVLESIGMFQEIALTSQVGERGVSATFETRFDLEKTLKQARAIMQPSAGGSGGTELQQVGKELDGLNLDSLQGTQQKGNEKQLENLDTNNLDTNNLELGN